MNCPFCNEQLPEDSRFCSNCGNQIGSGMGGTGGSGLDAVPYYQIPQINSSMPEGGKKKRIGKWIAVGGAALTVVICGVAAGAFMLNAKSPKEKVIAAFEQAFPKDKKGFPSEEIFGLSQLKEMAKNQDVEQGLELSLNESTIYGTTELIGSGIRIDTKNSPSNSMAADIGVSYGGMDLAEIQLYYGDKRFMAAAPQLSSYAFMLDLGDGLGNRLKDSPVISEMLLDSGIDADSLADFVDETLEAASDTENRPFNMEKLFARYQEGCKAKAKFKEALTVEKGEKKPFTIRKKEVKCQGYHTVISKEAMIDFLEESSDFFLEDEVLEEDFLTALEWAARLNQILGNEIPLNSPKTAVNDVYANARKQTDQLIKVLDDSLEDVEMIVYLDKKGNLAAFSGTTSIYADGEEAEVEFEVQLKGGDYPLQNLEAVLELSADGERITIDVDRQGTFDKKTVTDEISVDVTLSGESAGGDYKMSYEMENGELEAQLDIRAQRLKILSLSLDGTIDELEKGKSIHMEIDELRIDSTINGQYMALDGEIYLKPLEDTIKEPSGQIFDVLEASEKEWMEAADEIMQKAEPLFEDFY